MKEKLYRKISSLLDAIKTCEKKGNTEWKLKHTDSLKKLVDKFLDFDTKIDVNSSTSEKLVFYFSYEVINDSGYSDGYENYTLIVKPSLQFGINLRFIGKNKNQLKDYFYDLFFTSLNEEME